MDKSSRRCQFGATIAISRSNLAADGRPLQRAGTYLAGCVKPAFAI